VGRVTDLVYRDLRRLAAFYLNGESQANTQPFHDTLAEVHGLHGQARSAEGTSPK